MNAKVAQLVELTTENRAVGGSSPPLGTGRCDNEERGAQSGAAFFDEFFTGAILRHSKGQTAVSVRLTCRGDGEG
ncbi:MAG: hypothetical protein QOF33_607, partial [Thermomicrobiales bacterium]|nr:hypothetical protein [Thermomicrobiales bacterium]